MDSIMPVPWSLANQSLSRANLRPSSQGRMDQVEAASRLSLQISGLQRFRGWRICADGAGVTSPNPGCRRYPRHDALARYERDLIDKLELMGAPGIPGTASLSCFCLAQISPSTPLDPLSRIRGRIEGPTRWLSLSMSVPCGCAAAVVQTDNWTCQ